MRSQHCREPDVRLLAYAALQRGRRPVTAEEYALVDWLFRPRQTAQIIDFAEASARVRGGAK